VAFSRVAFSVGNNQISRDGLDGKEACPTRAKDVLLFHGVKIRTTNFTNHSEFTIDDITCTRFINPLHFIDIHPQP
jgi:hypothetical protein